jgi:hypothetical protein
MPFALVKRERAGVDAMIMIVEEQLEAETIPVEVLRRDVRADVHATQPEPRQHSGDPPGSGPLAPGGWRDPGRTLASEGAEEVGMPADHHVDLEVALQRVTARLRGRFDQIDPIVVEATVRRSAAEFEGANVEFVPVFVERHSAEALQQLIAGVLVAHPRVSQSEVVRA